MEGGEGRGRGGGGGGRKKTVRIVHTCGLRPADRDPLLLYNA